MEGLIMLLIYICIAAAVIYLVLYVLTTVIAVPIPGKVVQIVWVIFALIVILWLFRWLMAAGGLPGLH